MKINRVLQILIIITLPFMVLMASVRLLITPSFAAFEYDRTWFPKDPYGMSQAERLRWSRHAINYLTNDGDISYLGELRFDDGEALFNERELDHMIDVKHVVKTCLVIWYALAGFFFAALIWFLVMHERKAFVGAVSWGSWLTIGIIVAILIFLAVSFNRLFERFHQLFFKDGTWLFYQNDTLIRLFPIEFWRDAFILVCILSLLMAGFILGIKALVNNIQRKKELKNSNG